MTTTDLPDIGRRIAANLDSYFDPAQARTRQVLALVEEAGEFADAWDAGFAEEIAAELADVLITAHVTAAVFGAELTDLPVPAGWPGRADQQVISVAAAACRVAGSYRRAAGMARRAGVMEDVPVRLAEVVLAARVAANRLGVDLEAAVAAKVEVVFSRGWRDEPTGASS